MSIASERISATPRAARSGGRPPAGTIRIDVPLALLDSSELSAADIGAGLILLARAQRRGPAAAALDLPGRCRISDTEAGQHIDHLLAAGLRLGGAA